MSHAVPSPKPDGLGGVIRQKQAGYVLVRFKATLGDLSSAELAALSQAAERFGRGKIHITTRQGVEIPWVRAEAVWDLVSFLADAGIGIGASGARLRVISACQGDEVCPHAVGSTRSLALALDRTYYGQPGPAKFKIAVTGCPNSCAKPQENDLGFMAVAQPELVEEALCVSCGACEGVCRAGAISTRDGLPSIDRDGCLGCRKCALQCPTGAISITRTGWNVYLGGRVGRKPAIGRLFRRLLTEDEAFDLVGTVLKVWRHEGKPKERLGALVDRIGYPAFEGHLLAASRGRNGYAGTSASHASRPSGRVPSIAEE